MTTTNNTQGQGTNNDQNLGGNNMNVLNQIGALYSQLTPQEMEEITMAMLQGVLADPNRDSLLAKAGYVAPQTQAPTVNPNMVQVDAGTFNGMVQQIAQLQAQVQQLMQAQQPVQPQVPQFNFATQGTVDMNTINQAVNQAMNQMQQPVTPVQPQMDAAKLQRLQELELGMQQNIDMINKLTAIGCNSSSYRAQYARLQEEYNNLNGVGVVNRTLNGLDAVGTFGQERIANEFIPNVVNTTSSVLADGLNIVADLVQNVGGITVNTTAQVLQTGANTVGQIGTVASNAGQTYANSAFGLFRR